MKQLISVFVLFISQLQAIGVPLPITKAPQEQYNCGASFPNTTADGITLVSVTATDYVTLANVTASVIASSPVPATATSVTINGVVQTGEFVIFSLIGGTSGQIILIDVLVQDNVTGERFDGQLLVTIKSGLINR
jgi:hypothetical protein